MSRSDPAILGVCMKLLFFSILLLLGAACSGSGEQAAGPSTATPTYTLTPEIGVTLATRAPPTMAVVQTTPTPLPTATVTPSPTPITYVVEEGDTLLGIAITNRTSVEDIEALNPGVVPELLQIGQSLVLPPPATPIFAGEAATPVPLRVSVASIQTLRTPVGSMWLIGEVLNDGEHDVAGVAVQIDLVGPDGASLMTVPAWVVSGVLRPGERGPFAVLVREPPVETVQPVVAVTQGETLLVHGSYYLDLAVVDSDVTIDDGQASVDGLLENVGEATTGSITVVVTFYGAQGDGERRPVSGYAQQILEGALGPGERLDFSVSGAPPGGQTVDYAVTAYGRVD